MSWNNYAFFFVSACSCQPLREAVSWNTVLSLALEVVSSSASSWGCELKYTIVNELWRWCDVSLFVRLWVEIFLALKTYASLLSASSWGCELKCYLPVIITINVCQPLREAVSWNNNGLLITACAGRQPLREAVSWNKIGLEIPGKLVPSASSWGCELKYITI